MPHRGHDRARLRHERRVHRCPTHNRITPPSTLHFPYALNPEESGQQATYAPRARQHTTAPCTADPPSTLHPENPKERRRLGNGSTRSSHEGSGFRVWGLGVRTADTTAHDGAMNVVCTVEPPTSVSLSLLRPPPPPLDAVRPSILRTPPPPLEVVIVGTETER
jgi:hypothetical protein